VNILVALQRARTELQRARADNEPDDWAARAAQRLTVSRSCAIRCEFSAVSSLNAGVSSLSCMAESTELAQLSQAERMLATVDRADDALKLADLAEAARIDARKAHLGTISVNHATSIKARALRRMAECVDAGQRAGEIARKDEYHPRRVPSRDTLPATLTDLGIPRQRLHEARGLEALREDEIASAVEAAKCPATGHFTRHPHRRGTPPRCG